MLRKSELFTDLLKKEIAKPPKNTQKLSDFDAPILLSSWNNIMPTLTSGTGRV